VLVSLRIAAAACLRCSRGMIIESCWIPFRMVEVKAARCRIFAGPSKRDADEFKNASWITVHEIRGSLKSRITQKSFPVR